jgi:hypothetical protein
MLHVVWVTWLSRILTYKTKEKQKLAHNVKYHDIDIIASAITPHVNFITKNPEGSQINRLHKYRSFFFFLSYHRTSFFFIRLPEDLLRIFYLSKLIQELYKPFTFINEIIYVFISAANKIFGTFTIYHQSVIKTLYFFYKKFLLNV